MLKNFLRYPLEFLLLALLLVACAILFLAFGSTPHLRRNLTIITAATYLAWSLFYHWRRGDLTFSILVEYLVFALLGVVVLLSTVF